MLKHGVLLRVWLGHLNEPDRLKEILQEHIAHVDTMRQRVAIDAEAAAEEPAWAYPRIAMQWSERYFAAERELALQLIKDIDEADAAFRKGQGNRTAPSLRRVLATGVRSKSEYRQRIPTGPNCGPVPDA